MATKPFYYTHWLKRVLIPLWVIQLLLMTNLLGCLVFVAIYIITPILLVELIFCVKSIVLTVAEIILFDYNSLGFLTYLVFQIVKTSCWAIMFVIAVITMTIDQAILAKYNISNDFLSLMIGVVGTSLMLLFFICSLVYASVMYHRHRRSKRPESRYYSGSSSVNYHDPSSSDWQQKVGSPTLFTEDIAPRYEDARWGGEIGRRVWESRREHELESGGSEWRNGERMTYELNAASNAASRT